MNDEKIRGRRIKTEHLAAVKLFETPSKET